MPGSAAYTLRFSRNYRVHPRYAIFDSVTALQTDSTTTRALRCETMARQELESMPLAEFHDELRLALTSYYEGIIKMEGASGINKNQAHQPRDPRPATASTRR